MTDRMSCPRAKVKVLSAASFSAAPQAKTEEGISNLLSRIEVGNRRVSEGMA